MNDFDNLFDKDQDLKNTPAPDAMDDVYDMHRNLQRKNGILLVIYILIQLVVGFGSNIYQSVVYPNRDEIKSQISVVTDPAISVAEVTDATNDQTLPYVITFTATYRNDSSIELPQFWTSIEFFDADGKSLGVYTYTKDHVAIGSDVDINVDISTPFNPDSFQVTYGFDETSFLYTLVNFISFFITGSLFLFVDREAFKYDWKRFKQSFRSHLSQIIMGFIMVYVALWIATTILKWLGVTGTSANEMTIQNLFRKDPLQLVVLFLMLCIFTPIVEEVIFRKVLYNYVKSVAGDIVAILSSGAIFGLMHVLSYGDFIQAIPYIFMGLVFGYIYYRAKRNIFVTMGVHFLNNLQAFTIYALMVYGITIM